MVQLVFFEKKYEEKLLSFQLPEDQHQFTGLPVDVLEISIQDKNRFPIVISSDNEVVGFFVLHYGEDIRSFTSNPNAMLLRALSIDFNEQGKGYAKKAMQQLPQFVKNNFPQVNEIVLVVNKRNEGARVLYDKTGFDDTGEERIGEIGPQYLMHLQIK
ncbi:GNAT family N-acetyltransferase [Neobacillus sp. D3-1R]|uniref:GNAT family N-acetyltransferase n=1 Tax=Neobacillus sp. D3-1R TaxID=3445778 RepID=UPI003FA0E0AB